MKYLLLFTLMLPFVSLGNNVKVSNITRPAADQIKFDISWENSWYITTGPSNWDAAWVFVKYQDCDTDEKLWKHTVLSTSSGNHSAASPLKVDAVSDGMGVFVRRSALGQGNISATSITLKLGASYDLANTNFEVFAIEMVFVPQGSFYLGGTSGSASASGSTKHYSFQDEYEVTSEDEIPAGTLNTNGVSATNQIGYVPTLPDEYPKGYNSFYCMKYEISQEQWVRFLNLLTPNQQDTRTVASLSATPQTGAYTNGLNSVTARNGVQIEVPQASATVPAVYMNNLTSNAYYNSFDDGQGVAMNYINWKDLLAYLDWTALRPMSELEFEKAVRGDQTVIVDEYAWGNTNIAQAFNSNRTNLNLNNEGTSQVPAFPTGVAAYGYSYTQGPYRVGFAATSSSDRFQSGASYWGIMEMSGNVWEQMVSAGYTNGNLASFEGGLGNGELSSTGEADVTDWDLNPITSIVRGGSYVQANTYCRVASRYYINSTNYNNVRSYETGGRGVRQFNP